MVNNNQRISEKRKTITNKEKNRKKNKSELVQNACKEKCFKYKVFKI